jgi:hypothetical protein
MGINAARVVQSLKGPAVRFLSECRKQGTGGINALIELPVQLVDERLASDKNMIHW